MNKKNLQSEGSRKSKAAMSKMLAVLFLSAACVFCANSTKAATAITYIADDTAWDNYYVGGEGSLSAADKVVGVNSVKLTTLVRSDYNGISKEMFDAPLSLTKRSLRMYVKSTDWSKLKFADLILSSDGYSMNNTYTYDIKSSLQNPANNEWIEVVMPLDAFDKYGAPTPAYIDFAMLRIVDTGAAANLFLDGLSYFDNGTSAGVVSITFDDGWVDTYTQGKKKMDTYGYKGTAFVIPSMIGKKKYLTQAQVTALSTGGWDISGHGINNLAAESSTAMNRDVLAAYNYLKGKNYKGSYLFAYPNGAANNNVMTTVNKYFTASFNINGMNQPFTYYNRVSVNRQSMDKWTSVAMIKAWIDNAKANNEWCILNFHTLVATPSQSYDFSINNFGKVIDYLKTSGVQVKPVSAVITQ